MIAFSNGGLLAERASELPDLTGARRLYLDFETTSGNPRVKSTNPWRNCAIAGACVTADDCAKAWYVPIGHNDARWNVDRDAATRWLANVLGSCGEWCNHNVKYDAQVAGNAGLPIPKRLVCTLTRAKIVDSDRGYGRGTYALDSLSKDWLRVDVSRYEERIKNHLRSACKNGSQDYGDVPADLLGEYGCQDALTARALLAYEEANTPEQCAGVAETETLLTRALVDMEREGLRVDKRELQITEFKLLREMLAIEEALERELGFAVRPHVPEDCHRVLCQAWGLPILSATDKGGASFDKDALVAYLAHPAVATSKDRTRLLDSLLRYREINTLCSLFVRKYQELAVDGTLHATYNQAVRTGRMSASEPNAQQLSKAAKRLVHPPPGHAFISADYSQVEFRIIVHYINNLAAITAYAADPDVDFHEWVAGMCGIDRDPAKNVNFAIGFGAGEPKVLAMLASNKKLVADLVAEAGGNQARFAQLARARAKKVFDDYHDTLSELRPTSRRAQRALINRGYVFNAYGRRRRLPRELARKAFNNIVQSSAADLMKERCVATAPAYCEELRALGVRQAASVHDEVLFVAPEEVASDPSTTDLIARLMEGVSVGFKVPIRVNVGVSARNWADAAAKENRVKISRVA